MAQNISAKRRSDLEIQELEVLWLEIRVKNNKFLLGTVYRPPTSDLPFWDLLQDSIDLTKTLPVPYTILTGDFNADPNTAAGQLLSNFCGNNELSLLINEPTRITPTTATILDQFITNVPSLMKNVGVQPPVSINDHCTIYSTLSFKIPKAESFERKIWDFKNANFSLYNSALSDYDWELLFNEHSTVDDCTEAITNVILESANRLIPNKTVTIRPKDKPFYNGYLRRLRRSLDRVHKRAKRSNTDTLWESFRTDRNFYYREVKRLKTEFTLKEYNKLEHSQNSSRDYFKLMKKFMGFNTSCDIPPMTTSNGHIIIDDEDKANAFNDFFVSASFLDDSNANLPPDELSEVQPLDNIIITEEEVHDQIKLLDVNKAYGPDNISPVFLKQGRVGLCKPLTKLYNMSLNQSLFPKQWKRANVIPLFKKGCHQSFNNYRPVSLLSILGKIMERIVFKHLFNHFRQNFLISVWQSGFLPQSSTVTQLIEMYNCFCSAVTNHKEVRVVFLDISKAFDRVWHRGLIYKLKSWGVSGRLLTWLENYLLGRYQRVVINNKTSIWRRILAGVPQGSILGPLLFLVFINDITYVIRHCKIRLFADDSCLYIEVDNREEAALLINEDLAAIHEWSLKWLIDFSPPKTKSMVIGYKQNTHLHPNLFFNNHIVSEVRQHKHVGVWLQSDLWWGYHINEIDLKTSKRLNLLKFFKHKFSRTTLERIYMVFIRPVMEYASVVWGGAHCKDLVKLDKNQLSAMRIVSGATQKSNINNLYTELNWDTLSERRDVHALVMFNKIITGNCPQYLSNLIPKKVGEVCRYAVRNADDYIVPRWRLECHKQSFFPRIITIWNNLDSSYKTILVCELFKSSLSKSHLKKKRSRKLKAFMNFGSRDINIITSRLRMKCSSLNSDLYYSLHAIDSPACQCGAPIENSKHYFEACPLFNDLRDTMFNDINNLQLPEF